MQFLHLEDSRTDADLVQIAFRREWRDCRIDVVSTEADYIAALRREPYDVIVSDFSIGTFGGMEGLEFAQRYRPDTPFIFFSGTIREEMAIDAMRHGASDYVLKDRPMRLITAIREAIEKQKKTLKQRADERRIREQNELIEGTRELIVAIDVANRIATWNRGATRLLGWSAEEAIGQSVDRYLSSDPSGLSILRDPSVEWSGEVLLRDRQGRTVIVDARLTTTRDERGESRGRVIIATDVTEKHQLKEQFARMQRLESLGMLSAGIAHDLNNILAPMLMAAPLLRTRAIDPTDLALLNTLEKSAERGTALVRQIVNFARGVGGERQVVSLQPLISDLAAFIRQTFPKNIHLQANVAEDLASIIGSPTQLHQVLLNLCINAKDAMPAGGTLELQSRNCVLDSSTVMPLGASPGNWIEVRVGDTGIGIPADFLKKIWEPFFTTKGQNGTGLGLSTVRGIVEDHGGFVALESTEGRGTLFRVFFPAAKFETDNFGPSQLLR